MKSRGLRLARCLSMHVPACSMMRGRQRPPRQPDLTAESARDSTAGQRFHFVTTSVANAPSLDESRTDQDKYCP